MRALFIAVKLLAGISTSVFIPVVLLVAFMSGGGPSPYAPLAAIIGLAVVGLMVIIVAYCFAPGQPKWFVFLAAIAFPALMAVGYVPGFLR